MAGTHSNQDNRTPPAEVIARGYEPQAIGFRTYMIVLVCFAIFLAILLPVLWGVMDGFARNQVRTENGRKSPLAVQQRTLVPSGPLLQPSPPQGDPRQPWQDMQAFRIHENEILDGYSQPDATTGTVRIPIERAMQIMANRAATQPAGGGR